MDDLTQYYVNVKTQEIVVNYSIFDKIIFAIMMYFCIRLSIRYFYTKYPELKEKRNALYKKIKNYIIWGKICI